MKAIVVTMKRSNQFNQLGNIKLTLQLSCWICRKYGMNIVRDIDALIEKAFKSKNTTLLSALLSIKGLDWRSSH